MRTLTTILLLVALFGLARLNTYASSPDVSRAESHVLKTIVYGLGGGLLINGLCGTAAPHLDPEIKASDGFVSCVPFGVAATVATARIYTFDIGGWTNEEWWYARHLPRTVETGLRDMLGMNEESMRAREAQDTARLEL